MYKQYASAIIVAAGMSSRMEGINKQFLSLDGVPVLARTINAFQEIEQIKEIVLVVGDSQLSIASDLVKDYGFKKVTAIIPGGDTRQQSVFNGLKNATFPLALIHDGARPFIAKSIIERILFELENNIAVAPGVTPKDTIKVLDENGFIVNTPDRESLTCIQTPQGFVTEEILKAHQYAQDKNINATDDCALMEQLNIPVKVIKSSYKNIKITTPEDIAVALKILER